ncbi:MAG: hypothetical protein ACT6S0_04685 [Roseateles sp.]|uniref:hypothetical protein n=1 Tax=Roseateles sp. TaxID=1971397 RepID=UPI0040364400
MNARRMTAHRALPLPPDRPWIAPQGRPEQGWPARRCSPEVQPAPAEACTELGADDDRPDDLSPAEAYLLTVIYLLSTCIATWALCLIADALKAAAR